MESRRVLDLQSPSEFFSPQNADESQLDNKNSRAVTNKIEKYINPEKSRANVTGVHQSTPGLNHRKRKKEERGQNKGRKFASSREDIKLCPQVVLGKNCEKKADECAFEHDLSVYMKKKPADVGIKCPIFERLGHCSAGFRCRWLSGHVNKVETANPKTWTLKNGSADLVCNSEFENSIPKEIMIELRKRQYLTPQSNKYLAYLDELMASKETVPDVPFRPVEKRRLNWSGAKILAPLTTNGNLPFRQLCRGFGADVTCSEMAVSACLLSGNASEWALTRSHVSERENRNGQNGLFGIQLAGPNPTVNLRATEVLSEQMGSSLDFIDLNCGCPIDLIFRRGAGSALLDNQGRLLKILKGMSMVSGSVPITCKIRTGVSDKNNTAGKLLVRLNSDACVSMVTLHGRSRKQRYSRRADWSYIAECAAQIKSYQSQLASEDLHGRHGEFGYDNSMAFIGNGDIYTYQDWNTHMNSGVDGCMIARGALIKPWIFEEIDAQQHIDKTAPERLAMLEKFCHNGLAYWGSDQMGVEKTRRFMLEFMSFHHRYTPVGILEHGPLPMNERAPVVIYRDEQEKLLGSKSCEDWISISEMFLGKVSEHFRFIPKYKANSTEVEG